MPPCLWEMKKRGPLGATREGFSLTSLKEAMEAAFALPVDLEATYSYALEFVSLEELQAHALSSH